MPSNTMCDEYVGLTSSELGPNILASDASTQEILSSATTKRGGKASFFRKYFLEGQLHADHEERLILLIAVYLTFANIDHFAVVMATKNGHTHSSRSIESC